MMLVASSASPIDKLSLWNGLRYSRSSCSALPKAQLRTRIQRRTTAGRARAFFNLEDDPIVKEALKEPVAFLGGLFAGLLRLDLNEEPLKDWIQRTSESAALVLDDKDTETSSSGSAESPEEIQIE